MQGSKLYVGNFGYSVTKEELEELFAKYGEIKEIKVIEGRGFGFVEMSRAFFSDGSLRAGTSLLQNRGPQSRLDLYLGEEGLVCAKG
jgi:hypothetical protein